MIVLNKIYTKTGDNGQTALGNGQRVNKHSLRVNAYGTVDETNATVGLARQHSEGELDTQLAAIQNDLFDLGADLATPLNSVHKDKVHRINDVHIQWLESQIDDIDGDNESMQNFVMPGGTKLAASLHLSRTIARRAERLVVALQRQDSINPLTLIYLNRASDLLFAMARAANRLQCVPDVPWLPGGS